MLMKGNGIRIGNRMHRVNSLKRKPSFLKIGLYYFGPKKAASAFFGPKITGHLENSQGRHTPCRAGGGLRHTLHQHIGQGLPFVTNCIEGVRSLKWGVRAGEKTGLPCCQDLIFQCFSKSTNLLEKFLNNIAVDVRGAQGRE